MEIRTGVAPTGISVITDSVTTVFNATQLTFTGATITNLGGGNAGVSITGGTPGGLNTQLQYNNNGEFGGIPGAVTDGTSVSLTAPHFLNPTINGVGAGLATLTYPNTATSVSIAFPATSGTVALTSQLTAGTVTSVATDATLTGGTITSTGTLGLNLGNANTWTALQTHNFNALGTTTVDALLLSNTTAATVSQNQNSPAIHLSSQGWGTTPAATTASDWRIYDAPITGSTASAGVLTFQHSANGGAYSTVMTFPHNSAAQFQNAVVGGVAGSNAVAFGNLGSSNLVSYALNVGAGTTNALYLFGGAGTSMFRTALGGSISTIGMGVSNNYANVIISGSGVTTGPSGTNPWAASLAVIPPVITAGGGTLTNSASIYIDAAPTGATNNYSLFVNSGISMFGGNTTVNGTMSASVVLSTSLGSNLYIPSNGGAVATTNTNIIFGGASTVTLRGAIYGTSSSTLAANSSYSGFVVGASPITLPTTGTAAWLTGTTLKAVGTVTNATPIPVTNTATLYVDGASSAGTNNYALYVASGISSFNGDVKLSTVGNGLYVKEGTNATMGTGTLVGGTLVVSNTKVTASSRIFLTSEGGTITNLGTLYISARSAGTSFTVSSSNVLDAQTFVYLIVEPA